MKKNILAENMRRFKTKNLTEVTRLDPRFGKELKDIYRKLQQGEFVTDEIIDEMGDFYEEVYESGDLKLIQLYDNLRSVAEDEPEDQFPPVIALMKYLDSSNLKEQSVPKDVIEKIEGSAPYYRVYVKDGSEMVTIDFEDYEVMDKLDAYTSDMDVSGTDNKGQSWSVGAEAVAAGGGDWDWEFNWETLEKT